MVSINSNTDEITTGMQFGAFIEEEQILKKRIHNTKRNFFWYDYIYMAWIIIELLFIFDSWFILHQREPWINIFTFSFILFSVYFDYYEFKDLKEQYRKVKRLNSYFALSFDFNLKDWIFSEIPTLKDIIYLSISSHEQQKNENVTIHILIPNNKYEDPFTYKRPGTSVLSLTINGESNLQLMELKYTDGTKISSDNLKLENIFHCNELKSLSDLESLIKN